MGSTTRSAWCARAPTSMTGRPCAGEARLTRRSKRRRCDAVPPKGKPLGRPGRDGRTVENETPSHQKGNHLEAPGQTSAIEPAASIPRQESHYLVRGRDPEHQPVGRVLSRPAATAPECPAGADLRDAGTNLRTEKQQCALPGKADSYQGCD